MGLSLSCFASHQTVAERDLCRVVPIYQWASPLADIAQYKPKVDGEHRNVRSARMGWRDTGWHAIGEFFPAVLHDRCRIELLMSEQVRRQVARLLHHLLEYGPKVEPQSGPKDRFDLAAFIVSTFPELMAHLLPGRRDFDVTTFDASLEAALSACFSYLYKASVYGRLYIADLGGRLRPMEFGLVHEDAYQVLLARKLSTPRFGRLPVGVEAAIPAAFEKALADIPDERGDPRSLKYVRAGRVADRLLEGSDLTRELFFLNGHLQNIALSVFEERLTVAGATELLKGDIENVYALACLDDLGVPISPVVYAAAEDYENRCGDAYLDFVTGVNHSIRRSRKVALFGKFSRYELRAASMADVEVLTADAESWDCGFELVSVEPVPGDAAGALAVSIDVTADADFVQRVVKDINLPPMHESLKLVA
ncbi:hypothetical protein AB4Y45_32375 [Paraburkholderia sp. EG287A]|uniref:hypothetical protein n=1 Tax=Paraburkholderia sp. EG287A TaxID=3237012 RepID=UPI0034D1ECE9